MIAPLTPPVAHHHSTRAAALVGLFVVIVGALPAFVGHANHDVAWLVYAADRLLDGARLYRDIIEINPPLAVWIGLPAAIAAHLTDGSALRAFHLEVLLLMVGSYAAIVRVLPRALPAPGAIGPVLVATAIALSPWWVGEFGQREHVMVILTLPYLCLRAARRHEAPVARRVALAIGIAAGIGFSIKPYFVPLWALVEFVVALERRTWRTLLAPESLAVMAMGATYGMLLLWVLPDYLALIHAVGAEYMRFDVYPMETVIQGLIEPAVVVVLARLVPSDAPSRPLVRLLTVGIVVLATADCAQRRAWDYHRLPVTALTVVLATVAAVSAQRWGTWIRRACTTPMLALVAAGLLLASGGPTLARWWARRGSPEPFTAAAAAAILPHLDGGALLVLSPVMDSSFPLVQYLDVPWASRFNFPWFAHAQRGAWRAGMTPGERWARAALVQDLLRVRPTVIVTYEPWGQDYLGYLAADADAAAYLRQFRPVATFCGHVVYARTT